MSAGIIYRGYFIDQNADKWWEIKLDGKVVNVQVSQEAAQGWVDTEKKKQFKEAKS